ncbi:hypothetical protein JCM10212_001262 [Sporobolomyces blumeae]
MATLERTRDSTSTTTAVDHVSTSSTYAPTGPVPAAFPAHEHARGRPPLAVSPRDESASRSPNGTRRSLSKIGDRIKRAVSQARDSATGSTPDSDRGRRGSEAPTTGTSEEPRGRSPFSAFAPRTASASRGRASVTTNQTPNGTSQYPLSATQTRSTSRGRTLNGSVHGPGKIVSTGRGGAGNLIGFSTTEEAELTGEEDPHLVEQIRVDRSKSREREGRVEVASSGRGGRGNIRSQSRNRDLEAGRVPTVLEEQERVEREDERLREEELKRRDEREKATSQPQRWVSSGRGGAGNFHHRQGP